MSDTNNHRIVIMEVVEDILNDDELTNLHVNEVRRFIVHLQHRLTEHNDETEETDDSGELAKYVL